jgi:DcmR-like sensory protein
MPLESMLANFHFGEHNAIIYPSITAFHRWLIEYCGVSFKTSNEILLILTSCDSIESLLKALEVIDRNINSRQKDGSLVIRESAKAYFNLANKLVDILIMIRMLLQRKTKLGKDGLTVICDLGIFFHKNRIDDLISHEAKLSLGHSDFNEVRMICCYVKQNLTLLTRQQTQQILCAHTNILGF